MTNHEIPDPGVQEAAELMSQSLDSNLSVGGLRRFIGRFRRTDSDKSTGSQLPSDTDGTTNGTDPTSIYPDEESMRARISETSPMLTATPHLRETIATTIVKRGNNPAATKAIFDTRDTVFNAAKAEGIFDKQPSEVILDYMTFCRGVDKIKCRVTSVDAPADRSNAIMNLLSDSIVNAVPASNLAEYTKAARSVSARLRGLPTQADQWSLSKVNQMIFALEQRQELSEYIQSTSSRNEAVSPEKVAQDTKDISALFGQVISERKEYGIKLSYTESGLYGSLVFSELSDFVRDSIGKNVHAAINGRGNVEAVVTHSNNTSFDHLTPRDVRTEQFTNVSKLTFTDVTDLNPTAIFHLGRDGELYHDHRLQFSVRNAFVEAGKYDVYRRIQGEILTNYFDLTTSQQVTDAIGIPGGLAKPRSIYKTEGDPTDVMYDLIVPRLKLAREKPSVRPIDESEGVFRLHNVTYHKRKLAPGWKPSPLALHLAQEANYPLPEGYTFVRAHERGNAVKGRVTGHHVKRHKH